LQELKKTVLRQIKVSRNQEQITIFLSYFNMEIPILDILDFESLVQSLLLIQPKKPVQISVKKQKAPRQFVEFSEAGDLIPFSNEISINIPADPIY